MQRERSIRYICIGVINITAIFGLYCVNLPLAGEFKKVNIVCYRFDKLINKLIAGDLVIAFYLFFFAIPFTANKLEFAKFIAYTIKKYRSTQSIPLFPG